MKTLKPDGNEGIFFYCWYVNLMPSLTHTKDCIYMCLFWKLKK